MGVAFGRGHAQKHNAYISEPVFVGKYRHSFGSWLVVELSESSTVQQRGSTVAVWVGLDVHVVVL